MHPVLLNIGPLTIHTYGFLIALGFLIGVYVNKRLAVLNGIDPDRMVDLSFWCLISGFIGARLLFVLTLWSEFMLDPMRILRVWEGGLVFFGGPIAAVPVGLWYLRRHKVNIWKMMDAGIPGLVIGHAFGRLGCLAAGCCYGKPTGGDWGVRLHSDLVDLNLQGIPLHPTQLYESAALFLLFFALVYLFLKRKVFDGQIVLTYFMAYPIIRSIVEIYRGDTIRGFVIDGILSTSQFISILVFILATAALVYRLRQVNGEPIRKGA